MLAERVRAVLAPRRSPGRRGRRCNRTRHAVAAGVDIVLSSSQATDDPPSAAEAGFGRLRGGLGRRGGSGRADDRVDACGARRRGVGRRGRGDLFGAALVTAVLLAAFVAFDGAPTAGTTATDVRVGAATSGATAAGAGAAGAASASVVASLAVSTRGGVVAAPTTTATTRNTGASSTAATARRRLVVVPLHVRRWATNAGTSASRHSRNPNPAVAGKTASRAARTTTTKVTAPRPLRRPGRPGGTGGRDGARHTISSAVSDTGRSPAIAVR